MLEMRPSISVRMSLFSSISLALKNSCRSIRLTSLSTESSDFFTVNSSLGTLSGSKPNSSLILSRFFPVIDRAQLTESVARREITGFVVCIKLFTNLMYRMMICCFN